MVLAAVYALLTVLMIWSMLEFHAQKRSHDRGVGKPLVCKPEQEEDAVLGYIACENGYDGGSSVWWEQYPADMYKTELYVLRTRLLVLVIRSKSSIKSLKESSILLKEIKMKKED